MANSNWNKKDSAGTSSSREESSNENQGDGFEPGNTRQGGMSGAETGDRNTRRDSGLDDSRDRGMSGESDSSSEAGGMRGSSATHGSTGLGGETSREGSRAGGVEGTSTRDGREDPDRGSQR